MLDTVVSPTINKNKHWSNHWLNVMFFIYY